MNEHDHQHLRRLFDLAMAAAPGDRAALLELECKGDAALKKRLEVMIAAAEGDAFLSSPTAAVDPDTNAQMATILNSATVVGGALREGPGTRIGPYKLLQQIGEGGFGSVFMAQQEQPVQRKVALKIIKLGMDTHQVVARFEQERQALAILDHPNIAKVFDAGATETGRPYFVMELCTGEPIDAYCDRNNLSIPERLELIVQVCNAVQHAHTKGIIHRDLKPGNVLVALQDGKPHAKVIDFGIAKATASRLTERTLFTEHRQIIGTPEYMSPEQAEGSLDIDTRTDVYALGVMLYELLTGSTPFTSKELRSAAYAEIQRIIREVEPPKPSTRLSQSDTLASVAARRKTEPRKLGTLVRGELDWIVMKALEKDRSRRYESASGLMLDIRRYLGGDAVVAAPPSAGYRLRKFVRRNRLPVAAGSAVGVALLLGLAGTAWQAKVASDERDVAMAAEAKEANQRKQAEAARAEALTQKTRAEEKEAEAKMQAAISSAVVKFQSDMLTAVDPYKLPADPETGEPMKDKITVLQALEAATKLVDEGSLKDQPLVEAGVRTTIGDTLIALGRYEDSIPVLRRALEIRRANYPADSLETAQTMDRLGEALGIARRAEEAVQLLRDALAIRRRLLPPEHKSIAIAMNNLAQIMLEQGVLDESESLLRESVKMQEGASAADQVTLARTYDNLAKVLTKARKLDEAEAIMRKALDTRRAALPPGHPEIALGQNNLATVLSTAKKYEEAEQLQREALASRRATMPAAHPELAQNLSSLAGTLRHQGKFTEAESAYREALAMQRSTLPRGHPSIATTLNGLGILLREMNKPDEAEAAYREALQLRRAVLPPRHPSVATSLTNLGILLRTQNKNEQAEPLFREALEIRRAAFPEGHQDLTQSMLNLAGALDKLDRLPEARVLYDEAIPLLRRTSPKGSALLARALWRAGSCRVKAGEHAAALPMLEEAAPMAEQYFKVSDPQRVEIRQSLADCKAALAHKGDGQSPQTEKDAPR